MITTLRSTAEDRAWRIGAYGLAILIHVPLIVAVQQFGAAIAASPPVESVITLLDTPDMTRAGTLDTAVGRADIVTDSAEAVPAAPVSAARLEATAEPLAIAPSPSPSPSPLLPIPMPEAAIPVDDVTSIAGIIASDTLAPTLESVVAVSPLSEPVSIGAVETPTPPPSPAIAARPVGALPSTASAPVAAATESPAIAKAAVIESVTVASPVRPENREASAVAPVDPDATPVQPAASITSLTAPPLPSIAIAPATGTRSPTAVQPSISSPPPRIAIAATRARPSTSGSAPAPVQGGLPIAPSGRVFPASRTTAASAPRVVPVEGLGTSTTRGVAAVSRPSTVAPAAQPLAPTIPRAVSPAETRPVESAPQVAALPRETTGAGADRAALNTFMRGYGGGGCFAALTVEVAGTEVAVSGFSRDETELAGFEAALGNREGPRPKAAARQVSEGQCSALAFARAQAAYPDFPVRLNLDPDRIPSGGTIKGRLTGVGVRPVTMLILDDEGRIQDASFLLSQESNGDWSFETPLSLTGDPVPTVQLFVALAGEGPLAAMRPPVPVEARRYFTEIARLLKARGQSLDVALAAFTVDRRQGPTAP